MCSHGIIRWVCKKRMPVGIVDEVFKKVKALRKMTGASIRTALGEQELMNSQHTMSAYPPLFRSAVQRWDFANSTEGWYRQPYGAAELLLEDGCLVFLVTRRRNFNIRQRVVPFEASKYRSFRVRMKIEPNAAAESNPADVTELRLKWGTEDCPVIGRGIVVDDTRRVAACPVWIDGNFHEYALNLSTNPDWRGKIDELWFEACSVPHARVFIDWMRFDERAPKAAELSRSYSYRDGARPTEP